MRYRQQKAHRGKSCGECLSEKFAWFQLDKSKKQFDMLHGDVSDIHWHHLI
jgi:hypothetical protein